MKIVSKPEKKILKWVSKTDYSGFHRKNLEEGLKLKDHQKADEIFGFLKQEGYIQHTGGNSPLYKKTSKVTSKLESLKTPPHNTLIGFIFFTVLAGVIIAIIIFYFGLNDIRIKN